MSQLLQAAPWVSYNTLDLGRMQVKECYRLCELTLIPSTAKESSGFSTFLPGGIRVLGHHFRVDVGQRRAPCGA